MAKERIDKLLVDQGLVETRQKAQALILAGQVLADNQRIDKAGQKVEVTAALRIKGEQPRYVSRAGFKLEAALKAFQIDVTGSFCLDIGASTGGFTDCLLQHGARHVIALDVGHSQLVWQLRQHTQVEVREGVNARFLQPADFSRSFDVISIDVSFISLTKILPALLPLMTEQGRLISLIKPQFEVGKGEVGKGGIVTDPAKHARVIREITNFAIECGLYPYGLISSPITGADGNREFLAAFQRSSTPFELDLAIAEVIGKLPA